MLLVFKIRNFSSFKNETILDLRATSYTQHPSHVLLYDDVSLVKTTAIYGANASGKSNFVSAMFFFKRFILSQCLTNSNDLYLDVNITKNNIWDPFQLDDISNQDSEEFEIVFIKNNKQFQYGFEIYENQILNEWFYIDDHLVFERKKDNLLNIGKKYKSQLQMYNKVPSNRLYIAVLEYFLDDETKSKILNDFMFFIDKDFNIYSEILLEASVKKFAGISRISNKLIDDNEFRNIIAEYMSMIDVGIKGLEVGDEEFKDDNGNIKTHKVIRTIHNIYNIYGDVIGEKKFMLNKESSGTIRFLSYIQYIVEILESGGVFIVDELTARLHPLLTKLIINLFQNDYNKQAQLIFTTHDISLLNHAQFRRDEIVFIDKNIKGESTLYALSDLKIREDATFNKEYIQGKYGAIPIFNTESFIKADN